MRSSPTASDDADHAARPLPRHRHLPCPQHWILTSAAVALACLALGLAATHISTISAIDLHIDQSFSNHHVAALTTIALVIGVLLGPACGIFVIAVVCLGVAALRRSFLDGCAVGVMIVAGWMMAEVVKHLVNRPRPPSAQLADPLVSETGHDSFPSGHTALAASIAIALAVIAWRTRGFGLVCACGAVLTLMTGGSRVYLGAHYPTDVLGSLLAATAGALIAIGIWNACMRYLMRPVGRHGMSTSPPGASRPPAQIGS